MILVYGSRALVEDPGTNRWRDLFARQWVRANANLDETLKEIRKEVEGRTGSGEARTFEDVLEDLEVGGLVRREADRILPTRKTATIVREAIFRQVFGALATGPSGNRTTRDTEPVRHPERSPHTRPWKSGDDFRDLDWSASLRNILRRGVGVSRLEASDLEVRDIESGVSCATLLLIDVSQSMVHDGQDGLTPAKMVAIALAEHLRRRHPRDTLDVLAFGDKAWRIPIASIAQLAAGSFHTNTADGLRLAREILHKSRAANKRILLITDGKPSCAIVKGRLHRKSTGLDPLVVEHTLLEGRRCLAEGCRISTFMVARDPALIAFVDQFTRAVRGQAFYTGTDRLGEFVVRDWASARVAKGVDGFRRTGSRGT